MVVCADLGCLGSWTTLPEIRSEMRTKPSVPGTVNFASTRILCSPQTAAKALVHSGANKIMQQVQRDVETAGRQRCRYWSGIFQAIARQVALPEMWKDTVRKGRCRVKSSPSVVNESFFSALQALSRGITMPLVLHEHLLVRIRLANFSEGETTR
jgi:hypothetical protein